MDQKGWRGKDIYMSGQVLLKEATRNQEVQRMQRKQNEKQIRTLGENLVAGQRLMIPSFDTNKGIGTQRDDGSGHTNLWNLELGDSVALGWHSCNMGRGSAMGGELEVLIRWYGDAQDRIA